MLSIIWKSDLTDKMKRSFFQAAAVSILLYGCTTWRLTKRLKKKLDGNYTRMLRAILNKDQDDQLEHTYSSYVRIRDVTMKTCQRRWMIGRSGKRGSEISVLAARYDDDKNVFINTSSPVVYDLNVSTVSLERGNNLSNECPRYDTKPSDGKVLVLDFWGM